jgi:hypothetical protein
MGMKTTAGSPISIDIILVAIGFVVLAFVVASIIIFRTEPSLKTEVIRARFAMVTFTGILVLFIFTAILYAGDGSASGIGKDIFDKAVTGMTPLAGAIIGYLFGSRPRSPKPKTRMTTGEGRTDLAKDGAERRRVAAGRGDP